MYIAIIKKNVTKYSVIFRIMLQLLLINLEFCYSTVVYLIKTVTL